MAFKLLKTEQKEFNSKLAVLHAEINRLTEAKEDWTAQTSAATEAVREAEAKVAEAIEAMRSFAEDVAVRGRDAIEEKSDAWRDSDRGSAAEDFVSAWESVEMGEPPECDIHEELQEYDDSWVDELEGLPTEAE